VDSPGCFAAGGVITMPPPSISIAGQPLNLPLDKPQAEKLIRVANRAPFGRGEKTIVDTSVRCTWQLNPSQFVINNPKWEGSISTLLTKVQSQLGCDTTMSVGCELYKLLLYEPGGFFKVSMTEFSNSEIVCMTMECQITLFFCTEIRYLIPV